MTTGGVVHVITGLEVGGTEMLLLELCREESRGGGGFSVASLMSDGPMRERFAQIGVDVLGLGMRRGEFFARGLLRLVRLIRRVRPRVVQGWLYHGNLGAAAATWLSGVFPRPRLAWSIRGDLPDFACYPPRLRRVVGLRREALALCRRHSLQQPGCPRRASEIRLPPAARAGDSERDRFDAIQLSMPGLRAATRLALGLPDDAIVVIAVGRNDPMKNWPGMLAAHEMADDRAGLARRRRRGHRAPAAGAAAPSARPPRRHAGALRGGRHLYARLAFWRGDLSGAERGDGVRASGHRDRGRRQRLRGRRGGVGGPVARRRSSGASFGQARPRPRLARPCRQGGAGARRSFRG